MNNQTKVMNFLDIHQEIMILSHAIARKVEKKMTMISSVVELYFYTSYSYLKLLNCI